MLPTFKHDKKILFKVKSWTDSTFYFITLWKISKFKIEGVSGPWGSNWSFEGKYWIIRLYTSKLCKYMNSYSTTGSVGIQFYHVATLQYSYPTTDSAVGIQFCYVATLQYLHLVVISQIVYMIIELCSYGCCHPCSILISF